MITALTIKQKELLNNMIEETRRNYTEFNQQDKSIAVKTINELYRRMGYKSPIVIFAKNPFELTIKYNLLDGELLKGLSIELNREFFSKLLSELSSELDSELLRKLSSKLLSELDRELDGELRRELSSELEKLSLYSGIFWRFWTTYYRFAEAIGVKLNTEKLDLLENFAMHCPIIAPYKGICFVSELPKRVHFKNQKLHNDGGSCIEWRATNEAGKVEHFFLNGIKVPEYLAKTPTGLLDIEFFKNEKNADIKAEFIRKYGIDRMVDIGVVIDTYQNYTNEWWAKSEYKVIDMSPIFTTVKFAPHLYMKNQTTGIYHLEALTPDCKILKDAFSKARWNGRDIEQYKTLDIK